MQNHHTIQTTNRYGIYCNYAQNDVLVFPYFWSGIALLKKDREEGVRSPADMLIVTLSSLFILSAFASANLDELWLVIVLVMVVLGIYSLVLSKKRDTEGPSTAR